MHEGTIDWVVRSRLSFAWLRASEVQEETGAVWPSCQSVSLLFSASDDANDAKSEPRVMRRGSRASVVLSAPIVGGFKYPNVRLYHAEDTETARNRFIQLTLRLAHALRFTPKVKTGGLHAPIHKRTWMVPSANDHCMKSDFIGSYPGVSQSARTKRKTW
jgi:hypothetical protein